MGRPDFGRSAPFPAPPFPHALHDKDVDGVVAEGMDDGLPAEHVVQPEVEAEVEPEPALPLGCRSYGSRTSEMLLTSFPIYA